MSGDFQFDIATEKIVSQSFANKWTFIPLELITEPKARRDAFRLNSLGSLFYFSKVILRKHRLTASLHKRFLCDILESDHIKKVIEFPRDHFKSTIASECAPIWWSLPFTERDEVLMRKLGYGDEWILWMKRVHNQNTRTLLVSENITNAAKLGRRISLSYENNALFRGLFPEIIPDKSCPWSAYSYTHKRTLDATAQGEGTYDLLGVGGALQSRHYDRIVQDDLVGRDALNSQKIMDDTINYHQLLVGAFDSDPILKGSDNDELIIGNRWAYYDLNSYLRKEEPWFDVESHSAMGGCCPEHPIGVCIFPEEWTVDKLIQWQKRLKTYLFSCQFLNNPTLPGETKFREAWLRYYSFETVSKEDLRVKIVHEVKDGQIIKDILPGALDQILLIVDPNHAENEGRCNHAVGVYGWQQKERRIYLLDCWADNDSYDELVTQIYKLAHKWKIREIYLEDIAGQRLLRYPLAMKGAVYVKAGKMEKPLKVIPLKVDKSKNAKAKRIDALENIFNGTDGSFWIRRIAADQFVTEYLQHPHSKTKDLLDITGYVSQILNLGMNQNEVEDFLRKQKSKWDGRGRNSITGY